MSRRARFCPCCCSAPRWRPSPSSGARRDGKRIARNARAGGRAPACGAHLAIAEARDQGRAAGARVLGRGALRSSRIRLRSVAGLPRHQAGSAPVRPMARAEVAERAQGGARRAVRRAARSTSSCCRMPAATWRPTGARRPAAPCCAARRRRYERDLGRDPGAAPGARPRYGCRARAARCAAHAGLAEGRDGRLTWVNKAYVKAVEAASEAEVLERQIELLESRQR